MKNDVLNGYRKHFFWIVTAIVSGITVLADYQKWLDPCLVIYASTTALSFLCCGLFANWWRVKGSATSIFKWLTFLLLALGVNDVLQFIARWHFVYRPDEYLPFVRSFMWEYRSVPKVLALVYLLAFALWQRYGKASTYHDAIRKDMVDGFETLDAKIVAGELRFEGHSHEGLVLGAKLIIRTEEED